ncbi:MAG TPA: archaellin/type IV pilin N-terminal domain-containing protein [Nitrososphaerales archaeon]|nr:archaellin/type IV pilin N-terminal domain-containing protein [Nitrososphaerales archaeon]
MKFQRRRGVSIVVATLLMIAITVSAGVIVYVFLGGLAGNLTRSGGQSVNEKLSLQSFNFEISPGSCGCAQEVLEMFLLNPGPASTTISTVYFDGTLLLLNGGAGSPPVANTALVNDAFYVLPSATLLASTTAGDIYFSSSAQQSSYPVTSVGQLVITFTAAATYNSAHTVRVVSTTGAQNTFTVEAGISG